MYAQKRGIFVVVIVVLAIFSSAYALAEEGEASEELTKYEAVQMEANCGKGWDEDGCDNKNYNLQEYGSLGDMDEGECNDCDEDEIPCDWPPEGCYFVVKEKETSEDCAYTGKIPPGFNIDEKYKEMDDRVSDLVDAFGAASLGAAALGGAAWGTAVGVAAYGAVVVSNTAAAVGGGVVTTTSTVGAGGATLAGLSAAGIGAIGILGLMALDSWILGDALEFTETLSGLFSDDADAQAAMTLANFRFHNGNGVICGNDHYWYQCDEDHVGSYYSIRLGPKYGPMLQYVCTELPDGDGYVWEVTDHDWDHDGYKITEGDCSDNNLLDVYLGCPSLEEDEYQGLNADELREVAKSKCTYPANNLCAICINPGSPEVCGDKANNDCGAGNFEDLSELEGKTSDDCNKNQYACTQTAPPLDNSPDNATGIQPVNIYNQAFAWLNTADGGYCCGFNGIDDLGKTEISSGGEGQFLCLNKNPDLVGHDVEYTYASPFCGDEWCWVSPSTGAPAGGQFKIFTLKKPGEKPYDVASNGEGWQTCDKEAYEQNSNYELSDPNPVGELPIDELLKKSHRYRCYDEGDHYSWAECADAWDNRNNKGIKGRYGGEGLFTLPLKPEDPAAVTVEESRIGQNIDIRSEFYKDYYGDNYLFDFSGYDYLNFMVRFVDSAGAPVDQYNKDMFLPAGVQLEIKGPKPSSIAAAPIYFSGNVLGYVTNSNLFNTENFMQVRVPLSADYKGVSSILIKSSPDTNFIEVKNIYLSTKDGEKSQLCSGEQSTADSSWLSDIDQGDVDKQINGEKLCKALYGKNAWLGWDDLVEIEGASCCGNNPNEYYSGDSQPDENGLKYACWNSQPVASGDTIMDVEFEVGYKELEPSVSYPKEEFKVTLTQDVLTYQLVNGSYFCPLVGTEEVIKDCEPVPPSSCKVEWKDYGSDIGYDSNPTCSNSAPCPASGLGAPPYECDIQKGKCYTTQTAEKECLWSQDQPYQKVLHLDEIQLEFGKVWYVEDTGLHYKLNHQESSSTISNIKVGIDNSPFAFGNITLNKRDFISPFTAQPYGGIILTNSNPKVRVYLLNPRNNEEVSDTADTTAEVTYDDLPTNDVSTLYLMAELVDKSTAVKVDSSTTDQTSTLSFSCSQEECLYPLPGEPPYTIKNLHPELYELYFVTGSKAEEQTFIGSEAQTFGPDQYGNVKVKKLAQPILFVSDETNEPNFYGCQAASYLEGESKLLPENNLPYCFVKAGQFCAYSTTYTSGKEPYTTINSWSKDSINEVGYEDVTVTDEKNLSAFYDTLELNLKNKTFLPETRNHTAIVLPARNFLPNAEFEVPSAKEVPHWEILDGNGQPIKDEKTKVNEKKLTIAKGETLRSERIGVEQNLTFSFSQTSGCLPKIYLVDKDGKKEEVKDIKDFSTGSASYLVVEYTGPCTIEQPMLQLVDQAGPASYNYNSKYIQRSAAACCPETMCWNGYACVEEMSSLSHLSEHVAEGRDYRCIDGQWTASPSKWDWNKELWGFCPEDDQCLVLPSAHEGKKDKTFADFYAGEFPQCINDTQYIMDNYCSKGEWTSRTKFVATKLLEAGETDDYILYCTNYKEALVELDEKENYIGGAAASAQTEAPSLIESLNGTPTTQPSALCFESVKASAEGQRLVPDKENTCVNNVCILKYKEGDEWKVAFATTLNKPIDDPNSFLFSLDVPQSKLSTACTTTGSNFAECPLEQEDLDGNLWYSPELNSVIYAQESLPLTPGTFDKILTWVSGLFGEESSLSDEHKFVEQAQNFRELYLLKLGDKKVTAIQELQNEGKQMLVAEYESFTTPICDYLNNLKLPPEMGVELLEQLSDMGTYNCTSDETTQRVEAIEGLDFLWPQLTGKLRVE